MFDLLRKDVCSMIDRFEIIDSHSPRPDAERILFCDGTGCRLFRFPGYLWADTEGKWVPPGLTYHDGMSSYDLQNNALISAFDDCRQ
jgi:hypothetical protein